MQWLHTVPDPRPGWVSAAGKRKGEEEGPEPPRGTNTQADDKNDKAPLPRHRSAIYQHSSSPPPPPPRRMQGKGATVRVSAEDGQTSVPPDSWTRAGAAAWVGWLTRLAGCPEEVIVHRLFIGHYHEQHPEPGILQATD